MPRRSLFVIDVPAKRFEERIDELATGFGLVVLTGAIGVVIARETLDEIDDFPWSSHLYVTRRSFFHIVVSSL